MKKVLLSMICGTMLLVLGGTVSQAAESQTKDNVSGEVTFNSANNDVQEIIDTDKNGEQFTIKVEPEGNLLTRATTRSWKVSYSSITINAEFYMQVSGNKVVSAYNARAYGVGGTTSNLKLNKYSNHARLNFDFTSYGGWMGGNCWLQGRVTGKNNDINVSYRM